MISDNTGAQTMIDTGREAEAKKQAGGILNKTVIVQFHRLSQKTRDATHINNQDGAGLFIFTRTFHQFLIGFCSTDVKNNNKSKRTIFELRALLAAVLTSRVCHQPVILLAPLLEYCTVLLP